mmetsp:Transcript_65816/g.174505  ORF Transcript_65816/g.174505 Transcript_65816/m.174505 type:complete len:245 (+) Transcript_65816:129-863(+)
MMLSSPKHAHSNRVKIQNRETPCPQSNEEETPGTNSCASARITHGPSPVGAAQSISPRSIVIFNNKFWRHSRRIASTSVAPFTSTMRSPDRITRASPEHCLFQASTVDPGLTAATTRQPSSFHSKPSGTASSRRSVKTKTGISSMARILGVAREYRRFPSPLGDWCPRVGEPTSVPIGLTGDGGAVDIKLPTSSPIFASLTSHADVRIKFVGVGVRPTGMPTRRGGGVWNKTSLSLTLPRVGSV